MSCPAQVVLGDNLTFSVTSHDPDTGVLTDTTSVPAYRLYEDEAATPILTGNMAKLDDANTTGFYAETIECSAANGFEVAKTYTINITGTVDGDQGGIAFSFRVVTDPATEFVTTLMADTGITAGGTWTFAKVLKVITAWAAGKWQDKTGESGTYEILDPDDGTTVIAEVTPGTTTPYKQVTIN